MEAGWLGRMRSCRLYAYRLPEGAFRRHDVGGYWIADEEVDAVEQVVVEDLVGQHASARIELRVTPSVWPFWRRVTASTVEYSGSRLQQRPASRALRLAVPGAATWLGRGGGPRCS